MKRAAHQARRRRNIRRWSFVAAFGATTALGVWGWAGEDGLSSFFASGKTTAENEQPAAKQRPAPIVSANSSAGTGAVRTAGVSGLGKFIQAKAGDKAQDLKPAKREATPYRVLQVGNEQPSKSRLSGFIATSRPPANDAKQDESSPSTRVTLSKTDKPPHVQPGTFTKEPVAQPLQRAKQNEFLADSKNNRYGEPRPLEKSTAKPLGINLPGDPQSSASEESKRTLPPVVSADALTKEDTTPPAPAKGLYRPPRRTSSRSALRTETKPELTTRLVTKPAKSSASKPMQGPSRSRIYAASNQTDSDSQPALESPQRPQYDSLKKLLRDRQEAKPQSRGVRVARALQEPGKLPEPAANLNADSPFQIIEEAGRLTVEVGRSRLLKCRNGVFRTAIVEPSIVEAVQFTPTEVSLIGKKAGATQVTFWFENDQEAPQTYLVEVQPSEKNRATLQRQYEHLQDLVADLFPDSKVDITLIADKLIVRGQAKDSAEASQIMSIIRAQSNGQGNGRGGFGGVGAGAAARVMFQDEVGQQGQERLQVINLLQVPGVQQVALRVKIAELSRTAARGAGIDLDANIEINGNEGALLLKSLLNTQAGNAPALIGQIDGDQIEIGLRWLRQQGIIRVVSEPTLVTMSGTAATFVAGGEFAVPTVVGTGGLSAVTTDFRAFGAIISFMPTVVDKDRVRLQVSPEFSKIDQDLQVGGTPGLQVRAVTTTVEMREGQTLAIAGLLDESLTADRSSNLPWVDKIIGTRDTTRNETELIILVTPELVHPMEPEEVPPLPGFDVTEPTDAEFYYHSRLEGHPGRQHRSTIWPRLRRRYGAGGSSMISGPFGHGQ